MALQYPPVKVSFPCLIASFYHLCFPVVNLCTMSSGGAARVQGATTAHNCHQLMDCQTSLQLSSTTFLDRMLYQFLGVYNWLSKKSWKPSNKLSLRRTDISIFPSHERVHLKSYQLTGSTSAGFEGVPSFGFRSRPWSRTRSRTRS